jgi:hypothetical protein
VTGAGGREGFRLVVDPALRARLRELAREVLADLEGARAGCPRLFPPAHPDQPGLEQEYRDLVGGSLVASHRQALALVAADPDPPELDRAGAEAWLRGVCLLRLVLGTRLGVVDDDQPLPPGADPALAAPYLQLGWLAERLVQALSAGA